MRLSLVALLVFFSAILTGQNQPHPNQSTENTHQPTSDSNRSASANETMSTEHATCCWRDKQQTAKDDPTIFGFTRFELTIAVLTLIYVVLTGIYACISYKTLGKINEQIGLAQRSAKAAEDAAVAAKISADASMDTEQAILWIEQVNHWDTPQASFFNMRVWNSGKTIGTAFAGNGTLQVGDIDTPPDPLVFNYQIRDRFNEMIVDPDSQLPTNLSGAKSPPLTTRENACITSGANYLWACGYFRYRDIFKRVFERRYCYRFVVYDPIPAVGPKGEMRIAGPPDYNRLTRCDEPPAPCKALAYRTPGELTLVFPLFSHDTPPFPVKIATIRLADVFVPRSGGRIRPPRRSEASELRLARCPYSSTEPTCTMCAILNRHGSAALPHSRAKLTG
jgi:hypothetical protein